MKIFFNPGNMSKNFTKFILKLLADLLIPISCTFPKNHDCL